jgi:hypothetical protein
MKKALLVVVVMAVFAGVAMAQSPDVLAFEFGAGMGPAIGTGVPPSWAAEPSSSCGLSFSRSESFSAGYSFYQLGAERLNALTLGVNAVDKLFVRLFVGASAALAPYIGFGISYDLFSKKDTLFTALGIGIDWFGATTGGVHTAISGGAVQFGIKVKVGI